jgi:hypothetical protein
MSEEQSKPPSRPTDFDFASAPVLTGPNGTPYRDSPEGRIFGTYPECTPRCEPYCPGHTEVPSDKTYGSEPETAPSSPANEWSSFKKARGDDVRKRGFLTSQLHPFRHVEQVSLTNTGSEAKIEILGGSLAAVERVIEVGKRRKGRNLRYVCVCGHSEGAHSADDSLVHCQVGNVWCSCKYPSWVLLAENVRHFAHKTNGAGPNHALSKGIVSTQKAGYSLESLIKQECWMCNTPTDELVAVALIVREGTVRPAFDFDGQANTLWCRGCCDENRVSIWYPGSLV